MVDITGTVVSLKYVSFPWEISKKKISFFSLQFLSVSCAPRLSPLIFGVFRLIFGIFSFDFWNFLVWFLKFSPLIFGIFRLIFGIFSLDFWNFSFDFWNFLVWVLKFSPLIFGFFSLDFCVFVSVSAALQRHTVPSVGHWQSHQGSPEGQWSYQWKVWFLGRIWGVLCGFHKILTQFIHARRYYLEIFYSDHALEKVIDWLIDTVESVTGNCSSFRSRCNSKISDMHWKKWLIDWLIL